MALSSTEAEYLALSACAQEVSFVNTLLEYMTKVYKPSVIYEVNQGIIFLVKNRQVGIHTKHIDIRNHFLRDIVEDKYIGIQYIWSEDNPVDIMTNNTSEAYFTRHMKRITEVELWELMDTGRDNVKNNRVTYYGISHDKTEYSSHALVEVMDGKHKNNWILVKRSRIGKL